MNSGVSSINRPKSRCAKYTRDVEGRRVRDPVLKEGLRRIHESHIRRLENGGKSSFSSRHVMPALCWPRESRSRTEDRLMNLKWPCEFFVSGRRKTSRTFARTSESRGNEKPAISASRLRHIKMQISVPRCCMGARAQGSRLPAILFCRGGPRRPFFCSRKIHPGTRHYGRSSGAFRRCADSWQIHF